MPAARPLNEDPRRFREIGYGVDRGTLDVSTVDRYRASVTSMCADLSQDRRPESLVEPQIHAPDWREWLELCRHRGILAAVGAALDTDELIVLSSHVLAKPPGDGLAVAWHQDNTYWPGVHGSDVLTAWVAFDDVDEDNGCMRFIPRSHDGHPELEMLPTSGDDLLGVHVEVTTAMEERAVPVVLNAGDVSLHDSFLIHSSTENRSGRWRVAYTIRYADASTTQVDLETHGKPVYYVAGLDQGTREGYRDLREGRTLPEDPGEHRPNRSRRFQRP
jgi:ectoine hydroxylase-related dioxygenase (phytanoyl-CoA dioxygenase family)